MQDDNGWPIRDVKTLISYEKQGTLYFMIPCPACGYRIFVGKDTFTEFSCKNGHKMMLRLDSDADFGTHLVIEPEPITE